MIFWITLLILIGLIVWEEVSYGNPIAVALSVITAFAIIIMVICLIEEYSTIDGFVSSAKMRYEMLTYQYENGFYENDNDVGKYELVSNIQRWNEDLSRRKALQRNFWVGIFIPNIYDQFEFIELTA